MRQNERDQLQQEIRKAYELINERRDYEEGLAVAGKVRAALAATGETSAYVEWLVALGLDMSGKSLEASEHIERAHASDTLEPAYNNSRRIIYQRIRQQLFELETATAGEALPRLYQALIERGEGDWDCHVHMAHWLAAQGRLPEMRRLLEAVTLLHPGFKDAWQGLSAVAADVNDGELKSAAEAGLTAATVSTRGRKAKASA